MATSNPDGSFSLADHSDSFAKLRRLRSSLSGTEDADGDNSPDRTDNAGTKPAAKPNVELTPDGRIYRDVLNSFSAARAKQKGLKGKESAQASADAVDPEDQVELDRYSIAMQRKKQASLPSLGEVVAQHKISKDKPLFLADGNIMPSVIDKLQQSGFTVIDLKKTREVNTKSNHILELAKANGMAILSHSRKFMDRGIFNYAFADFPIIVILPMGDNSKSAVQDGLRLDAAVKHLCEHLPKTQWLFTIAHYSKNGQLCLYSNPDRNDRWTSTKASRYFAPRP